MLFSTMNFVVVYALFAILAATSYASIVNINIVDLIDRDRNGTLIPAPLNQFVRRFLRESQSQSNLVSSACNIDFLQNHVFGGINGTDEAFQYICFAFPVRVSYIYLPQKRIFSTYRDGDIDINAKVPSRPYEHNLFILPRQLLCMEQFLELFNMKIGEIGRIRAFFTIDDAIAPFKETKMALEHLVEYCLRVELVYAAAVFASDLFLLYFTNARDHILSTAFLARILNPGELLMGNFLRRKFISSISFGKSDLEHIRPGLWLSKIVKPIFLPFGISFYRTAIKSLFAYIFFSSSVVLPETYDELINFMILETDKGVHADIVALTSELAIYSSVEVGPNVYPQRELVRSVFKHWLSSLAKSFYRAQDSTVLERLIPFTHQSIYSVATIVLESDQKARTTVFGFISGLLMKYFQHLNFHFQHLRKFGVHPSELYVTYLRLNALFHCLIIAHFPFSRNYFLDSLAEDLVRINSHGLHFRHMLVTESCIKKGVPVWARYCRNDMSTIFEAPNYAT